MDCFIDLDRTLFDTDGLAFKILDNVSKTIASLNKNVSLEEIFLFAKQEFEENYATYPNVLIETLCKKYNAESRVVFEKAYELLKDTSMFVYDDSIKFLKNLKHCGHNLVLLSFCPTVSKNYQQEKFAGSGLAPLFDKIVITDTPKWELEIDFENSIFVDDNAENIEEFAKLGAKKVVRVKRPAEKYSHLKINSLPNIVEICSLENFEI